LIVSPLARDKLRVVVIDLVIPLDTVGRNFEEPGQHDGRKKAESEDQDDGPGHPFRGADRRQDRRQDLGQQPAYDEISGCNAKDIASTKFGNEGHPGSSAPWWDRGYTIIRCMIAVQGFIMMQESDKGVP